MVAHTHLMLIMVRNIGFMTCLWTTYGLLLISGIQFILLLETTDQGYLAALRAFSGVLLWDMDNIDFSWPGWSMNTAPVIDTVSRIIITTSRFYMTAVDMDSHEILWSLGGDFVNPAVYNNVVYSVNNENLYAYESKYWC